MEPLKNIKLNKSFVADKPERIIIQVGTNDITNSINSINLVNKVVKNVKKNSPNTKFVFSVAFQKKQTDSKSRLKNYCLQTHLDFINNSNVLQEHLGNMKLYL